MALNAGKIRSIYSGSTARHYDLPITHFFSKYKKAAFDASGMKPGDRVLVFCCGTGLDFPHILRKIGEDGEIVGVDFSSEMLARARARISRKNWANVTLIEADVTKFAKTDNSFDVGVCTLGISIIPDYLAAYRALAACVKPGGEVIIGDMQLASGGFARLNPVTLFMAKRFGGSHQGHANARDLRGVMNAELTDVRAEEFFLRSYYFCIGKKAP
ncbi:MAG: methyltransferase domain-containing protein [Alphaproteobacteria bacterium]|jgi:ubiquinone/menaquinone biosynthesis C-methylase UbiE|nr:methyltransferase domain-containing protein [Alphaproteobacteria bacterium]MBT4710694.1 methyltransferase domain-containing protein [Alphaproteobacteria bacterium]MBT5860470.1 methyltransferase domain-containing protein [Alphaproteobacteria bacterium]